MKVFSNILLLTLTAAIAFGYGYLFILLQEYVAFALLRLVIFILALLPMKSYIKFVEHH